MKLNGEQVPQTRKLAQVRQIVQFVASGETSTRAIATRTGIDARHVSYALVTARALGLLDGRGKELSLTDLGRRLCDASADGVADRRVFIEAVTSSPIVSTLAPGLLSRVPPTKASILARMTQNTSLASATAEHRAGALLAWRTQLGPDQPTLPINPQTPQATHKKGGKQSSSEDDIGKEPEIDRIRKKLAAGQYPQLVRSLTLDGLRGFKSCRVEFAFPIVALVGENGAGKTTILKALACAYEQARPTAKVFSPGQFFMATQWDKVTGVKLSYSIKHGNEDKTVALRKPTERWRGIEDRPRRHVFLFDISRTMPMDALVGYAQVAKTTLKLASEELEESMRDRLSWVMGRSYKAAKFVVSDDKRVGVLTQAFGDYSKYHQGAGEAASLDLLGILQTVPDNSLVLIDEVEASMHPKAQRRLMKTLLQLCRKKTLQLIITTHSRYILEELPPEARILLLKSSGTKVVYGASPEYCLSAIDDRNHPDLTIFVEDREAAILVREVLARSDREGGSAMLSKVEIVPAGASNVVVMLNALGEQNVLRYPCIGVVDGDTAETGRCVKLPGTQAPEREVFARLAAENWPAVAERFGVGAGEMISHLEDAALMPDHHHWCTHVGNRVKMARHRVWENLAAIWASILDANEISALVDPIQDRLA